MLYIILWLTQKGAGLTTPSHLMISIPWHFLPNSMACFLLLCLGCLQIEGQLGTGVAPFACWDSKVLKGTQVFLWEADFLVSRCILCFSSHRNTTAAILVPACPRRWSASRRAECPSSSSLLQAARTPCVELGAWYIFAVMRGWS